MDDQMGPGRPTPPYGSYGTTGTTPTHDPAPYDPGAYAPAPYANQGQGYGAPPTPRTPEHRALRRQGGIIAGVCGGLGAFFGINPWWFRLLFLILLLPGGLPGLTPYVVLWLVIPRER